MNYFPLKKIFHLMRYTSQRPGLYIFQQAPRGHQRAWLGYNISDSHLLLGVAPEARRGERVTELQERAKTDDAA